MKGHHPETYIREEVRPVWYLAFWGMWVFDLIMFALVFLAPNYAALWLAFLVAVTTIGGYSYKALKRDQPLPDDGPPEVDETPGE